MIITAVYIYGIALRAWEFSLPNMVVCFGADTFLVRMLSSNIRVNVKNEISNEEKFCWNKRTEVEELRRVKLDRELYGKR
jgi:hypothetical protein